MLVPVLNFDISLKSPHFLRSKSEVVWQLFRQLVHSASGDNNLGLFNFW